MAGWAGGAVYGKLGLGHVLMLPKSVIELHSTRPTRLIGSTQSVQRSFKCMFAA